MESQQKKISINVQSATLVELDQLVPFQGDLKRLDREEYEKLRKLLIDEGFSLAMHVWVHDGKFYLIDGHQRVTALKMLRENEGFLVPPLPVSLVQAPDMTSAKRKVLLAISQSGKYTEKSLADYMRENQIKFDTVVAAYNFPGLNMEKFSAMFSVVPDPQLVITPPPPPNDPNMVSKSDGVKQANLYYGAEDHADFLDMVNRLTAVYKTENISDTVLEALRAAIKAYNSHPH